MIGKTLGSYRIVEQVGLGGMATVYKAYDPDMDRYVALKVLPDHYAKDPTFRARFQREAVSIARLEHLHILPVHGYGEEDGITYLVMRYIDAGTLKDLIERGPLPFDEAARLLGQIADALDYAHEQGILHRDVKPSNVLIDDRGNAYLTDFGIARIVEGAVDLTGTGIVGTPRYMSPEQCRGERDLTPESDIYALGVVLYEMVTGLPPFQAETPLALIHQQLTAPLPPPRTLRPDLPEDAERVLLKALAKEPGQRWPTCRAMADAFAGAVAGMVAPDAATRLAPPGLGYEDLAVTRQAGADDGPVETLPVMPGEAPDRRRFPAWLIGLLAVIVIGGAVGIGLALRGRPAQPTADLEPTAGEQAAPTADPGETATGADSAGADAAEVTSTTPPTEAPTPVPTDLPVVTAEPLGAEGQELFFDDFEDGDTRNWIAPGWDVVEIDGNRVLRGMETGSAEEAIFGGPGWTNYALEFDIMIDPGEHDVFEITTHLRQQEKAIGGATYKVFIRSDQALTVWGRDEITLANVSFEHTGKALEPMQWYHFRYEVFENQLRVLIDDVEVAYLELDDAFTSGAISFEATRGTRYLDNMRVIELAAPESAEAPESAVAPGWVEGADLFTDDFEGGGAPGWQVEGNPYAWSIVEEADGNAVLRAELPDVGSGTLTSVIQFFDAPDWQDYVLSFRFKVEAVDSAGEFQLATFIRDSRVSGELFRYRMEVSQNGSLGLTRQYSEGGIDIELARINQTVTPGEWYTVRFAALGDQVALEFDGERLFLFTDPEPKAYGGISLGMHGRYPGQVMLFDDVRVTEISAP